MRLVIIESPYAGDFDGNITYARACVRDSLSRGEAPLASHLLYTQPGILNDELPEERQQGIDAGLAWRRVADASVVYTDRGISDGMKYGIDEATRSGLPVEYRSIRKASLGVGDFAFLIAKRLGYRGNDDVVSAVEFFQKFSTDSKTEIFDLIVVCTEHGAPTEETLSLLETTINEIENQNG